MTKLTLTHELTLAEGDVGMGYCGQVFEAADGLLQRCSRMTERCPACEVVVARFSAAWALVNGSGPGTADGDD